MKYARTLFNIWFIASLLVVATITVREFLVKPKHNMTNAELKQAGENFKKMARSTKQIPRPR